MPVARSVESLKTLLAQINALAPNRSKKSDGWIGDAKHASRLCRYTGQHLGQLRRLHRRCRRIGIVGTLRKPSQP